MDVEDEAPTSDLLPVFNQENTNRNVENEEFMDDNTSTFESNPVKDVPSWPYGDADQPNLSLVPFLPIATSEPEVLASGANSSLTDPFDDLISTDDKEEDPDVKDDSAVAGVCGLHNLGNTCFIAAGIQCLIATPPLLSQLLGPSTSAAPDSLSACLSALTHKMWSGQYAAVHPSEFKRTLGECFCQFEGYRQHDCQEFLALLLDSLHEQLNSASLDSKLKDTLETLNCDPKRHINPSLCDKFVNISKEIPSTNDYLKNTNNLKDKMEESINEFGFGALYADMKMNNCDVSECFETNVITKLPQSVNHTSDNACDLLVKNEETIISNKMEDSTTSDNILNNSAQRLNGLEDILKDAKTSNVNVLVTDQIANNEIKFDSDKFPKPEKNRLRDETFAQNSFHLYDNNTSNNGKRGMSKSTVTHYNSTVDFREGLDLKRLKLQRKEDTKVDHESMDGQEFMDCDMEKNHRMEDERKLRDSIKTLDKNYWMECERLKRNPDPSAGAGEAAHLDTELDHEAEEHWQKLLATQRSVIVDTFQGQFKSTVVCATCKHVSVTYEPFMYLSVPLPHAMERQLCVTFVSGKELETQQLTVTVNKENTIGRVKEQLKQLITQHISSPLVLAEVLEGHISKILDDYMFVRSINDTNRSLYAFEVPNFPCFAEPETSVTDDSDKGCDVNITEDDNCIICLEEKNADMKLHLGCSSVICDSCIARSKLHFDNEDRCGVCKEILIEGVNLVPVSMCDTKPPLRMLNVSLVFRLDTEGDGSNNARMVELFGHPRLMRLPNVISAQKLQEAVASLVPYSAPYKILLVNGKGHHCSRCLFNTHCRGCAVPLEGTVNLHSNDCLAAMFLEQVAELSSGHLSSNLKASIYKSLTLYDCLEAFGQSDVLDEENPWYCPTCKKNQCATMTLRVSRYPNYLIIYIKRFIFQNDMSLKLDDKVIFPIKGLDLSISGGILYDLYACISHVGGTGSGHYFAYAQHARSGEWHLFNDACVTKKCPQEDDFSTAYILFYKKRGAGLDLDAKLETSKGESQ